ncbi:HD domain-containing protein [Pelotalea chapellei]|uniref:HD domain-containing protein n=1 Tax=Pelotalea chapellei TaxID=44671 RepID=A0ABS5U5R4_9BACT|nr:HD domain-containing protein [Pelotalea chapellei]MBT1071005.1 HD domain-containing protein [Pelotalea chapellei]
MVVDSRLIMGKYFEGESLELILIHGKMVAELAVAVGHTLGLEETEIVFLEEAAMLHDIGVCRVNAPGIGVHGGFPYITHGIHGREILDAEGLPRHALVCERHIGVGLTVSDIVAQELPLPHHDMTPQNLAEEIICFSDLFYSKNPHKLSHRKTIEKVRCSLGLFGEAKVLIFDSWLTRFGKVL